MSNNLFISYELSETNENEEMLCKLMSSLGNSTPLLNNCWYINSPQTAQEALNILGRALTKDDKIIIANTSTDSSVWAGIDEKEAQCIRQNWKMMLGNKLAS